MRSSLVFLGIVVLVFSVNGGQALPLSLTNNLTPHTIKTDKTVVFNCNSNQDSNISEAIKALETKVDHLIALVNKTSTTGQPSALPAQVPATSCKEQYEKYKSSSSQVYSLKFGSQNIPVYCHMGNFGCGDGGWTLAMKIDGSKETFHYDSHFWSDRNTYNLAGGKTGFNHQETKLPTYWSTPFSKICLGMKVGHQIKFIAIYRHANSLYSLIADGNYRATSLRRSTWKTLIGSQASLETSHNKEGFNSVRRSSYAKARIGIIGSHRYDGQYYSTSKIGFGTGGYPHDTNTCGNDADSSGDNGEKHIRSMGYILVQ